jgi:hypothetical protein
MDIFSSRGIIPPWQPDGHVARAQGFVHYVGATWRDRRAVIAEHEPLYGRAEHPDSRKANQLWIRAVEKELGHLGPSAVARYVEAGFAPTRHLSRLAEERERLPQKARQSWDSWLRGALGGDGWLMPRHAVMPDHEEFDFRIKPVAQLRPHKPAFGRYEWHHHGYDLSWRERRAHERTVCEKAPQGGHTAQIEDPAGAFLPTGHLHSVSGEVAVPFGGRHRHWTHAKYIYTPGDTALRLGTNPVALERGWGGPDDLFVVVMEGTLKMCSVVEAGYPTIDSGSVTLWHGGTTVAELDDEGYLVGGTLLELQAFAERHLWRRPVAVVCDSDWHRNELVWDQTQRVVGLLNDLGANAVACAPPEGDSLGWVHPVTGEEMREKVGVDDFLGRGNDLRDLVCQLPGEPASLKADDPRLAGGTYRGGREATVRVLREMGAMASPGGDLVPFRRKELAERLEMKEATVEDALNRGVAKNLAWRVTEAVRRWLPDERRGTMEAPLVRLVPEALAERISPRLGTWLDTERASREPKSAPL